MTTGPFSIWQNVTFAQADAGDTGPAEVGITFQSDEDGLITGLRFYKYATNTGTHVGNLWTADGKLLASATFTNETASGWQEVTFKKPVAITADTQYVASYSTDSGHYTAANGYFADYGVYTGPLHSDARRDQCRQGGGKGNFPTQSTDTYYGVDVVFQEDATKAPKVKKASKQDATTGVNPGTNVLVKFDKAIDPTTVDANTFQLINEKKGTPVPAKVSYDPVTRVATLLPTQTARSGEHL